LNDAIAKPGEQVRQEQLAARIDRLYRRHHRAVYRLALRYGLGDEAWAEDVTQDVFMILLDKLPGLAEHEQLDGWLYRVTCNRCLRRLERDRFRSRPLIRALLFGAAQDEPSIEARVFAREDLERARVALGKLPARERIVLGMVHLDGKSQREVCEALGLSKGYVSKLLARAIARMEEELRD
jgi:RNA polymerase sigma-70 factor, ECF subfamily